MSRASYNSWDPSHQPREPVNTPQDQSRDPRQGTRLPPPESLVAGNPCDSALRDVRQRLPPHPPGPDTYMHHSHSLPPLPPVYTGPPPNNQPRHYSHPGHIPPAPSQASSASSANFSDPRLYRAPPSERHPYPRFPQHIQWQLQQPQPPSLQLPVLRRTSFAIVGEQPTRAATISPYSTCLNILGDDRADALEGVQFQLVLRQQPQSARSCGFGDRDRRVVDPPPIVQMLMQGPKLLAEDITMYLRYEHYVMNCTIKDPTGTQDAGVMPEEFRGQRRLMGTVVASPFFGKDESGKEGCFFCFSDLSCRQPGPYRLHFNLLMIDTHNPRNIGHFPSLGEVTSEVFMVYNAKDFPGMVASSKLARRLKEQGCIISIKKGADKPKAARNKNDPLAAQDDDDDDNDDDDDDGDEFDDGINSQGKRKRH